MLSEYSETQGWKGMGGKDQNIVSPGSHVTVWQKNQSLGPGLMIFITVISLSYTPLPLHPLE